MQPVTQLHLVIDAVNFSVVQTEEVLRKGTALLKTDISDLHSSVKSAISELRLLLSLVVVLLIIGLGSVAAMLHSRLQKLPD